MCLTALGHFTPYRRSHSPGCSAAQTEWICRTDCHSAYIILEITIVFIRQSSWSCKPWTLRFQNSSRGLFQLLFSTCLIPGIFASSNRDPCHRPARCHSAPSRVRSCQPRSLQTATSTSPQAPRARLTTHKPPCIPTRLPSFHSGLHTRLRAWK